MLQKETYILIPTAFIICVIKIIFTMKLRVEYIQEMNTFRVLNIMEKKRMINFHIDLYGLYRLFCEK
jgi:hypothetical protein